MDKKVAFITEAKLIACSDLAPLKQEAQGKFLLIAKMVIDRNGRDQFAPNDEVQTSTLLHIDIVKNEFETLNTIYKVIPRNQVDVYRMSIPQ